MPHSRFHAETAEIPACPTLTATVGRIQHPVLNRKIRRMILYAVNADFLTFCRIIPHKAALPVRGERAISVIMRNIRRSRNDKRPDAVISTHRKLLGKALLVFFLRHVRLLESSIIEAMRVMPSGMTTRSCQSAPAACNGSSEYAASNCLSGSATCKCPSDASSPGTVPQFFCSPIPLCVYFTHG